MKRHHRLLALALAVFAAAAGAQPAAYPNKPIRLVIGFAPAGAADFVARSMSDAFAKALGQPVVVDNKPGNGSSIAAEIVAKSPPDGYTLLIASPSSISVNPALNPEARLHAGRSSAGHEDDDVAARARGQSGDRHPLAAGADRGGEEGSGQAQLFELGQRLGAAPRRCALHAS